MNPPKSHVEAVLDSEIASFPRKGSAGLPKERLSIRDQHALRSVDIRRILNNEVEVIDDRIDARTQHQLQRL